MLVDKDKDLMLKNIIHQAGFLICRLADEVPWHVVVCIFVVAQQCGQHVLPVERLIVIQLWLQVAECTSTLVIECYV